MRDRVAGPGAPWAGFCTSSGLSVPTLRGHRRLGQYQVIPSSGVPGLCASLAVGGQSGLDSRHQPEFALVSVKFKNSGVQLLPAKLEILLLTSRLTWGKFLNVFLTGEMSDYTNFVGYLVRFRWKDSI